MMPTLWHMSTYWLLTLTGMALVIPGALWQGRHLGIPQRELVTIALVSLIAGYFGAQLFSLILNWSWIRSHWWMSWWEQVGETGLVLYGWTLGAFGAGTLYVLWRKLPFAKVADLFCPWMAFAQIFNRLGCFAAGCCYGTKTALPWGVTFPQLRYPVHPTQLYEAGFDLALFLGLLWVSPRKRFDGQVALLYFLGYATWRFGIEFIRGDARAVIGPLTFSQGISLVVILASLGCWMAIRARKAPRLVPPSAQIG